MTSQVKALLFDVFGTVVDWRGSITREMQRFGKQHTIDQNWEQFALDWRALYDPSMERIRSGNRDYVKLDELHLENLMQLVPEYSLQSLSATQLNNINQVWHRLQPWPDCLPGLHRLKRQYTLATLSNGNVSLMVNMARNNGLPWDAILGSEPTRAYKPQAEVYLGSIDMLSLQPEECVMVAAHNYDLQAARELGLKTAYINRPYEYGDAQKTDFHATENWDYIGDSMTEIAEQLGC